jgi:flavodoxin
MGNDRRKVSEKIYIACLDLEDLYARAIDYRKNIEGELEEEEIETSDSDVEVEDDECVYVIKTWGMEGEYTGLLDTGSPEYKKEWKTEAEARGWFYAMTSEGGQDVYSAMSLIKIDPTKNEDRETCIEDWEDEIYESEDEV